MIELIVVIVILGILAAVALPKFFDTGASARIASIQALAGGVKNGVAMVRAVTAVKGAGTASNITNITFVNLDGSTQVRVWSGYPDRWCDGVGATLSNMTVPSGGCYLSNAGIVVGSYTFYGFGNSQIPGGDAGWRIESAPTPMQCSVRYTYAGTGVPVVTATTTGC